MPSPLDVVLVFSGDASKATQAINSLNSRIQALTTGINGLKNSSQAASKMGASSFSRLGGVMQNLQGSMKNTIDGFRLMSQGIMSVGRAMTFFVAIPLGLALRSATQDAMTFEEQMIRVRKTTGMAADASGDAVNNLVALTEEIRKIAREAPESHEQLGIMAEQAGQLGIKTVDGISKFVRWMEILSTSTNISSDEVVKTMGKIANAFGWSIDQSVDEVVRLANVMNVLENNTAATAAEIAESLFRFAPQAQQLRISAADAAALAAALVSLGVSSESTGTRLGNMFIKLTQNADKFAELASATEKYATRADVLNAINEDAVGVLFDLILMMDGTDNRAQALAESFDLVGLRGGRALGTLAQDYEGMTEALELSRREWEKATSLIDEYNIALTSAQNHSQILKNNITDIGIEFGRTLLPAINELMEFFVPALRMLGEAIRNTSRETKLWIAIAAVGVVVLGPLLFLVSQVAFGFFMLGLGLLKLVAGFILAVKAAAGLAVMMTSLGVGTWAAIAAVIAATFVLKRYFADQANQIADFFKRLASSAKSWGENLAGEIANGLISGAVKFITQALHFVGNLIARFLESRSPPELGPLAHIDKWGKTLIDTYLNSMTKADFNILKDIGRTIGNILKNFAVIGKIGDAKQFIFLLEARQNLAKLLAVWRKTGKISEEILNSVVSRLGEASDEIKKLIVLNLKYLKAEEALIDLEKRREQFLKKNKKGIIDVARMRGKSAEERVAMMRELLRERLTGLRGFAEEEESLTEQRDLAKEQLETHKAMVEAMQEQDDIQARLIGALEKLSGAMESGFQFPEIEPAGTGVEQIQEALDAIQDPIFELELKFSSKQGLIELFMKGLRGEPLFDAKIGLHTLDEVANLFGIRDEDMGRIQEFWGWGNKIHTTWNDTLDRIDALKQRFQDIMGVFDLSEGGLFAGITIPDNVQAQIDTMVSNLRASWDLIKASVLEAWLAIQDAWNNIAEILGMGEADWGSFAAVVMTIIQLIVSGVGFLVAGVITLIAAIVTGLAGGISAALTTVSSLLQLGRDSWTKIIEGFQQMVSGGWRNFWQGLGKMAKGAIGLILSVVGTTLGGIVALVVGFVASVIKFFVDLWHRLVGGSIIPEMLSDMFEAFVGFFADLISLIVTKLAIALAKIIVWALKVKQRIQTHVEGWLEAVRDKLNDWRQLGKEILQKVIDGISAKASLLIAKIRQIVIEALQKAGNFLGIDLMSLIGGGGGEEVPGLQHGGIVNRPTLAVIGEGGEPEVVMPISMLQDFIGDLGAGGSNIGELNLSIDVGSVRSERDIERIAEEVVRKIERVAARQSRLTANRRF